MIESSIIMKQLRGTSNSVAITESILADKNLSPGNSITYILAVFAELFQVYACSSICTFLNLKCTRQLINNLIVHFQSSWL
jgi:hypothetical protein